MKEEIIAVVENILEILHDVPTETLCRYFEEEEQECLYKKEDEHGSNWCNNCVCWHVKVGNDTGVKTIYHKYPKASALHASLLKEII